MKVKEFKNSNEEGVNNWISENTDSIEIIDIKYSTDYATMEGYPDEEFSNFLVIYSEITIKDIIDKYIEENRRNNE